jgi:sulfur carrier protein ThiS
MSDATPGATSIFNPPAPTDAQAAADRIEALHQDAAFMERVKNFDASAFEEHTRLWRIQHGLPAEPQPPQALPDVFQQQNERVLRETETRADLLRAEGFEPEGIYEVLNGRPIPLAERQWHEQELARLKRDKAWVQKYFDGDRDARFQMRRHTAALTLPVARSLEEIHAWQRAHNRPLSE